MGAIAIALSLYGFDEGAIAIAISSQAGAAVTFSFNNIALAGNNQFWGATAGSSAIQTGMNAQLAAAAQLIDADGAVDRTGREGEPMTVRYDQINAMLLNEFLKEHRKVERLEKQVEALTAGLQKVSAQLELNKPAPQTVKNTD